jgi:hypothetical protein
VCSAGFRIDYYIYGGTPPYRVSSTFPTAVTLLGSPVATAGGVFTAITNGTCVNPLVFTILDAVGRQTTATLINQPGTGAPPTPPTPPTPTTLTVTSSPTTVAGCGPGTVFSFVVTNGTPPYNFSATTNGVTVPAYNPATQQVTTNGGGFTISNLSTSSSTQVSVVDSGSPQQSKPTTLTCNP